MSAIPITYIIIGITAITSFMAFSNQSLKSRLLFHPTTIKGQNQWDRFLGHGFIHADMTHLLFNMITLYFFGTSVEYYFGEVFGQTLGTLYYVLLYFLGMIVASIPSYMKHSNNPSYAALGASGAVSAVLFASILFQPFVKIYIFFIPIGIWGIIFGPIYLIFSAYMARNANDNIGHDAHFWGAVFGVIFPIILNFKIALIFWNQIADKFGL